VAESTFERCLAVTWSPQDDGQPFHDTAGDPGGDTAWGITLLTLSHYLGRQATPDDLRSMTLATRTAIYATMYWPQAASLPIGADLMVFDFGVVDGPATSAKMFQKAVGLSGDDVDGWIGPKTLALAAKISPRSLITSTSIMQHAHVLTLNPEFRTGWVNRIARDTGIALSWIAPSSAAPPVAAAPAPMPIPPAPAPPQPTADDLMAAEQAQLETEN
jgi:lysozyme family protein